MRWNLRITMQDVFGEGLKLLKSAVMILAALSILAYLVVAIRRLSYPFELEWMEGAMVNHVQRVLAGQPLYLPPTIEFIPFIYTPFYFYLSAIVSRIVGEGFLALRLVSFASSLGSLILIALIVRRETGQARSGFLAAAFFAATYQLSGAWFDIARVDSLFLVLTLAGIWFLRGRPTEWRDILAALCFSLAFFTKQAALGIALFMGVYTLLSRTGRQRYVFVLATAVLIGVPGWILNTLSDGWFSYYVFNLPSQHDPVVIMIFRYWTADILRPLAYLSLLAIMAVLRPFLTDNARNGWFYLFLLAGTVGVGFVGRVHPNGYLNVLIPVYAGISIAAAVGLATLEKGLDRLNGSSMPDSSWGVVGQIVLHAAIVFQFILLLYNPLALLPTAADRAAAEKLQDQIGNVAGQVYLPFHGYLAEMEGKQSFAHAMAISDVFSGDLKAAKAGMRADMRTAFQQGLFEQIILDDEWMLMEIEPYYSCEPLLYDDEDALWPVVGMQTRPQLICTFVE